MNYKFYPKMEKKTSDIKKSRAFSALRRGRGCLTGKELLCPLTHPRNLESAL